MRFKGSVLFITILLVTLLVPMVLGGCSQSTATVTQTVTATASNQSSAPVASSGAKVNWVFNWGAAPDRTAEGSAWAPGGRFEQLLLKNSGGRFTLTIREAMVPKGTEFDLLATNKAQISDTGLTDIAGTYPIFDYAALPFRFNNLYELEAAQNDPRMKEIFDKVSRSGGNTYLGPIPSGVMTFVWAKKPILTVNDFKGLKVRVRGAIAVEALSQLGAAPVSIPQPEMADALFRGVVDSIVTTLDGGVDAGLLDIVKDVSVWGIMPARSSGLLANAAAFDALPADLKQALVDTCKEISQEQFYAANPEMEAFTKQIISTNVAIVYPSNDEINKARQLTSSVVDNWLKTAGPYGQEVIDISSKYIAPVK